VVTTSLPVKPVCIVGTRYVSSAGQISPKALCVGVVMKTACYVERQKRESSMNVITLVEVTSSLVEEPPRCTNYPRYAQ
jgi:hypothetical protein